MSEHRPFPPSPRRLALARASGLSAASPVVVGAVAAGAAALALVELGHAAAERIGAWISHACGSAGDAPGAQKSDAPLETLGRAPQAVLELAVPLLVAVAVAALIAHVAQTRALWFPRRRLPGAPAVPRRSRIGFELVAAVSVGATCIGWLWITAPRLARLFEVPGAAAIAIVTFVVTLAIAWLALGVLDALLRRRDLDDALAMTREEKREGDRLSAADPRWAARRRSLSRSGSALEDAVARSAVVLVGEQRAVAIEWDPVRTPVPVRTAIGRGPRATQLVALARRHRVRLHLDEALVRALGDADGPVPQPHWARLAEIIAALREH